jgi:GntR family transcriptional regulator / MocR family aminotransferase
MSVKSPDIMWDRLLTLSAGSPTSLQDQIRQQMVAAITARHLPLDTPVPSGRDLAVRLGVARNTVVLAYQHLVDDGFLIARKRRGYFVNPSILASAAGRPVGEVATPPEVLEWSSRFRFRPSAQRNITKAADWQNVKYPFIYGQFDPTLFPTNEWRECCQKVLSVMEIRDWAPDLFTRDDPQLIEQIRSKVLPVRGVFASADEIMITIGAQHALYLLADLLMSEATRVGIENPGYPDARNIFGSRTAALKALPIDAGGLKIGPHLRGLDYVYATPSHQSPTTVTMPMDRRAKLLERAEADDFLIIEDDYESETRFSGVPNPSLKSLDRAGRVIYIGSLSKSLAPGLRLGYVVAPQPLIDEMRALRRLMIRHPTAFIQRSFALFLSLGHYAALTRRLTQAHGARAAALSSALRQHLPEMTFVPVDGGSSFWLFGPGWLDSRQLAADAMNSSLLLEPGDVYFMSEKPPLNCFRLGLSSIPVERIEPGIRLLSEIVAKQRKGRAQ